MSEMSGGPRSTAHPLPFASRLARLRVPLGFGAAVIVGWLATPTRATVLWGAGLAAAGEALRIWAAGHLNKSREVTRSGPYRWLAHPLYTGSAVMGVGIAVACASVPVAAVILVYMTATIAAAVRHEEAFLRAKFGAQYDTYRRGQDRVRAGTRFSLRQAIANREYRALLGLTAAALLLWWKATYNGSL